MLVSRCTFTNATGFRSRKLLQELSHAEDEGLKTICGTNEYMAPEMILRKGYGKAVDWWSMGALVYEMTAGYPPFQGKTPKDLNRKILNERVSLPKWLSPTAHQVSDQRLSVLTMGMV